MLLITRKLINKINSINISIFFRWLLRLGPPLPIPNREVKLTSADGTGQKPGEYVVADLRKTLSVNWGFFVFYYVKVVGESGSYRYNLPTRDLNKISIQSVELCWMHRKLLFGKGWLLFLNGQFQLWYWFIKDSGASKWL